LLREIAFAELQPRSETSLIARPALGGRTGPTGTAETFVLANSNHPVTAKNSSKVVRVSARGRQRLRNSSDDFGLEQDETVRNAASKQSQTKEQREQTEVRSDSTPRATRPPADLTRKLAKLQFRVGNKPRSRREEVGGN